MADTRLARTVNLENPVAEARSFTLEPAAPGSSRLGTCPQFSVYNKGRHTDASTEVLLTRKGLLGDDMEKPAQNIQDSFLNNARKDKIVLAIYLMSGVKLSGRIKSFDKYSLVLETNNQEQLIFKHAISTVVVTRAMHGAAPISQTMTAGGGAALDPGGHATEA